MTYHERDNEKDKKKIKPSSPKTTTPNTAKKTSSSKASATGSSFTVGKVPKLGYTNYNGNVGDSYPVGGVSPVTGTTTKARYTQQGLKQTWHGKSYKDLTYAEYTAMARKTNAPQEVFDRLEYETTLPGSQFYNPYKSGTQHQEIKDFFAKNYGYTGEFDDDFVTNYRHFLNGVTDDMRSTTTGSLTSPGKSGTTEQWAAYYYNQIARYNKESNETNAQWSDMRNAYADFYREFETVYQRKPTMEEFVNAVDINDYSKLKAIEDSYTGEKSLQVLNVGTNYSRDAITGLYYALQNGEDISVDRDYVEDAVEYYMNPVQQAPSVKGKYGWSNSDLSAMSNEDAQGYLRGLAREGKMEEYAAFNEALWQSRPHDDSVDTTNILGETYGYYQNDEWFDAVGAALGDEYTMRLQRDGSMKKPGSNASIMDQACYEYYQAGQKRAFANEVESAVKWIKSAIGATKTDLYAAEDYELYHDELMNYIRESDAYKTIEKYIEDPTKSCRPVFVSEDGIGAMIARHWKGLSIDENYDYSASAPYGYSDMFTTEKASEPPVYYDQQQEENAVNDLYERRSNKQIFSSVIQQLSESGANISLTDFEVEAIIPQTYSSVEGMSGIVKALWYSVVKPRLDARLGADASYDQILASDPVLKVLNAVSGITVIPELTLGDIAQVSRLTMQSDISNDDPSLAMGIIENTLPGINGILNAVNGMYEKYGLARTQDLFNGVFDAAAYRSAYADAKAKGLSEEEAASSAIFKATSIVSAMNSIGSKYEGSANISAAASELTNGVRLEEGTNEVVDILEIVNDEVLASSKPSLDVDSDGAPDMSAFNAAIMIGSTSYADPGFSAFTKDIVHDIATGDIKAEHVAEGVKAYNDSLKLASPLQMAEANLAQNTPEEYIAAQKAAQTPESRMVRSAEGVAMSAQDYTAAKEEARNYMSGFVSPEEMSDNLKKAIGYDHLMAYLDEVDANDIPVDRMAVLDATIASFCSENKTRHRTSELMHGATDIDAAIAEYASQKTDADRQTNITATERNYFQAMIEDDRTNFLSRIAAVAGYLSSDAGRFVDAFDNNGMFFSNEEVATIAKAYFNGDVTLEEVFAIIDDRKENYDVAYVNALNNPAAMQDSYAVIDAGMENLTAGFEANEADATSDVIAYLRNGGTIHDAIREYPESMAGIAENLDTYTAQAEDEYGGTDQTALMNLVISELEGNGGANATTEEQMSMAQKAVDFYKSLGPAGYLVSYMTNEQVKSFSNGEVDLSSVGIASLKSVLDRATDGAWTKPYGNYEELNLAYTVFGGVSKGIGKVIVAPANMLEVIRHGMDAVTGDWYTENVASLPGPARLAMRQSEANANIDSSEAEYAANVLTNTDIFLREGISEFVRNLMISDIGRGFAGVVEKGMPVSDLTYTHMVDDAIAGIADIDKAIKMSTTIARRLPFAANVFANDTLRNYKKSKSFSKSFIKGVLSAGIELGTESMGLEKMLSFNVRGMKLTARAMSAVNSNSAMMLGWMSNTAKNIVTEIGQEEAAMFLGRVVDFGDAAITQNKSIGEAFNESFSGMGEEAKATALSTAFTTLMFGAVDLGGMTYQNSRRHMENGTEYSSEQLLMDMLTDIISSLDEETDIEEAVENESETEVKPVAEAEAAAEAEPAADVEAVEEEVAQEDSEEPVSKSEDEVAEAVKNQILNPSEENVEAVVAAVEALETAPAEASSEQGVVPAEVLDVFRAAKDVTAPISFEEFSDWQSLDKAEKEGYLGHFTNPSEDHPYGEEPFFYLTEKGLGLIRGQQAPAEASSEQGVVPAAAALSPEAQKVYNYLEQSDAGIDKGIVKAGSKKAAEQAVENDPGVKTSRKNIEAKKAEIAETEGKIAQIAQGIQQKKSQQAQAFAAAVDQGIDPTGNNPLVLNPKMSLGQAIDGMAGEQAKLEEDLGKKQTEVQRHQQELDERTQEILAQAEAESSEKLSAQMQQFREERLREADQYANAYRDKDGELQSQGLMTGDEYLDYKKKSKTAGDAMADRYAKGEVTLDDYVDPGYTEGGKMTMPTFTRGWKITPNMPYTETLEKVYGRGKGGIPILSSPVETGGNRAYPASPIRDNDDWQDEQKRTEEERNRANERQIRLTQEFFANEDSRGFMLEQPKDVYDTVVENMRKELGYVNTDLVSERGSYKSEVEATMSPLETGEDGELVAKESAYEVNSDGEVVFKDPTIKSVLAGTDDIGDNKTDVGHDKYVHVTENDQYLVIKKRNDSAFEAGKKVKDAEASNVQKEAEIALQRWDEARDMYDRALADYDKAVEKDVAASERFAATSNLPLYSREVKAAASTKKNTTESVERAKRRLDAARSRVAYAQKQAEEVSAKMSTPKKKNAATRYIVVDKKALSSMYDPYLWGNSDEAIKAWDDAVLNLDKAQKDYDDATIAKSNAIFELSGEQQSLLRSKDAELPDDIYGQYKKASESKRQAIYNLIRARSSLKEAEAKANQVYSDEPLWGLQSNALQYLRSADGLGSSTVSRLSYFDLLAISTATDIAEQHKYDRVDQLVELCTSIQANEADGEYRQSLKELLKRQYSEMSADDLKIEYYRLVLKNVRNVKVRAALNSAFQYVDSKKGLDAFIAENGGEAEGMDQSQGKGFQTFTKRQQAQTKYLVSEYALRKYGGKKNAGGASDEQYDLALAKKFNDFARKAGASADDAEAALGRIVINPFEDKSGESTFKKVTRGPKFSLMVRNQDRNNPDVNSWIRDNDARSDTAGEYSEQMAWDRIAKKMSDIVWGVKERGKINVKTRNVIDIKYIDENGEARVKRFGEYYGKNKDPKDTGNYWFPSVEWVKENAIEVTCNFFCKNPGDKKTTSKEAHDYAQASRLNIKLVPNPIADKVDREYNPQDNFAEDAYMRTRWELAEDYKRAAKDFNENPNSSFFARAFYEAEHNGLVNTMNRIAGQYNAGGVTADKRTFLEGEFVRCRTKLELVTEELRKLEKAPFKEVPANTSARENAPASSDKLSQLRERLALLTSGNPQYDLPFYETEKKALESLISYYSNQTEAGAPVTEQNTEEQAATPIYTDDQIAAVTERVNSTVYDSEESFYNDLAELKDMADAGADVSALRSGVIKQYHDLKMKGMNQNEKMEYLYALAENAKKNPDSYTIDPNTDYEAVLGTSIEDAVYGVDSTADQRKLKGQLYNIKRRAGTYKSAKAIDSALKRLDGLEKAGLDVSDVRSTLEENRKALEPLSEVAKKPPITSFRGDHSFLSNFHDAPVTYEGVVYRNAEAAFQAAKSTDPKVREGFTQLSGKDAKRKGRTIQLRSDWNDARLGVMEEIVRNKFKQNPELAKKLIDTNGSDLVEGNTWRDTFWGVDADTSVGENNLGKILMKVRDELVSDTCNPNQERIDEALEAVEDEETKVDLQFFAEDTPDGTLDSVYDKMPDDLKEFSWRDDGVNTGFNDMAAAIEDANDLIRDRSAFEYTVSEIGRIQSEIKTHTDDINRVASDINKLKSRAAEIRSRMKDIEAEAEEGWRHEHVQEYNDLHAELMSLDTQKAKMQAEKDGIVEQRNSAKATQQKLSMAVLASDVANDILNNRATFSPKNLKTANVKAEFSDGRASGREMLSKVTAARMKNRVDGRLTTYTPQQLAEYYGEAIDEKAMAFDNEVATVLNRQVKEMKKAKILLELESTWLTNKNVRDGDKKITRARAEAIEAILALTPPKGYTEADYRKQMSNRDKAIKTVAEFMTNLENSYTDQAAIDLEYRVVGEQLAAINGAIERGEKAVSDYFNISSKGLNGVMDGTNGGHTPHAVMQIDLAMILDGAKKSSNPKHVVARNVDEPVRVIDKYLGENADIFNSRYMAPVIEANGKIADRKNEIREQMKALKLSKDEGIAVFHALDQGMNENDIRTQYPEIADKVMAATPVVRQILDELIDQMNVTLVRNGLDPVKRRNNYVPYIRKEENDLLRAIGVNTSYDELPTALLGNTEGTTPAHQFNQHMLEREGADVNKCIQDINEVIERYAASTLPVIYQTDNIIRFDDLIEAVNENVEYGDDLTYDKGKLSVFRTFLSDYRDSLAGKKVGKVDRAIEANVGRKYFGVVRAATKAKGLSATMGNNSVVAANVIPLITFFAMDPVNTLKATYQTILHQGFRIDDGVMRNASFNKARSQGYREAKSTFDKVTNAGYKLPSVVDELVAEIGYRSHYNSSLARNGAGGADQAAMNASNFVYRVMSDKNTGMKPMLYSTSWGSMALQFTQEAVNNISFIVNDLAAYEGYRKGDLLSMATGSAKALAALIAMFFGGYWINRGTGRNVALDPYGAYEDARKSAGDDASVVDIAKSTVSNFVDTANPMSSVTEGGLLGAPVVSGVIDVLEPIWNMAYNGELDQWKELAKGIFNWAPASVAMKRLWDTYQAVNTGYTTTAAGRIKYPFEGTAENIVRSSLFGPNSTEAGQEYVSSGYRSLSESQTRQMDAMMKQGITPSDAYRTVVKSSEASSEASKAKAGQKIGADVSEHTDAAKAARSEMEIPVEMADVPAEHMQRDSVKKGIEIWRETGEAVYFKPSISFSKNTYGSGDRVGVERGGVFYEATPEEQEKMNQRYFREYDRILNAYDPETGSVAELKKALSNAESRIRADFAKSKGGE